MWTCAHICSLRNRISNSRFENAHLTGHLLLLVWCKNKASSNSESHSVRIAIEDPLTKCVSRLVNGKCPSPTLLAVLEKEWFTAGQALPFESETDPTSPTFLRAYAQKPSTAEPPPQERQLNFKTGLAYGVDREARLMRRHVERQAAKLAAISTETELMEEALPQEPPAHIADAVEAVVLIMPLMSQDRRRKLNSSPSGMMKPMRGLSKPN